MTQNPWNINAICAKKKRAETTRQRPSRLLTYDTKQERRDMPVDGKYTDSESIFKTEQFENGGVK